MPVEGLRIDRSRDVGVESGIAVQVARPVPGERRDDEHTAALRVAVVLENARRGNSALIGLVCCRAQYCPEHT